MNPCPSIILSKLQDQFPNPCYIYVCSFETHILIDLEENILLVENEVEGENNRHDETRMRLELARICSKDSETEI